MKALILAAGRGSRLNEFTKDKNKSMLSLFHKPLLEYNLEHAYKARVKEIIIVIGYRGEEIKKYIGGNFRGIKVSYVTQEEQKGLVHAIECAKDAIGDSDFFLMLGDEFLVNANIKGMIKKFRKEESYILCGVVKEKEKSSIGKTYSIMGDDKNRIYRLIEKPRFPINDLKGTGHCIMRNDVLRYIPRTPINMNRGEREMVDLFQLAIDEGKKVGAFKISEGYVNVNTEEDLRIAEELMKKGNPRVLIVHTQMRFLGGAELLVVELANWLTKRGIRNDILALSSSREVEDMLIDTEIIIPKHNIDLRPPGFKSGQDILKFIMLYRSVLRKLEKNYDVLNFHNFPVTWTLYPRRKPSVWMLNEPPNLWSRPNAGYYLKKLNSLRNYIDREIVRNSMDVICVADEFNKGRCITRYKKIPRIVYYGVNHEFFSNGDSLKAIKKYNLKNKFVILHSGMITEAKNQMKSLETIKKIKDKIPEVLIVFAGKEADQDYKRQIDDYIKKNNLENHVLFTGNLNRNELRDLNKAADMGIFPTGKQGGWLAPFEVLCAETPVVVSKEMGAASVIEKFNLGTSTEDYVKSILDIYENKKDYDSIAKRASIFIRKNLGWSSFTDKLIKAFKDAWKKH